MILTVQAIYEGENLLRLLSPLPLKKGDHVEVTLKTQNAAVVASTEPNLNAKNLTEAEAQMRLEIVQSIAALAVP